MFVGEVAYTLPMRMPPSLWPTQRAIVMKSKHDMTA